MKDENIDKAFRWLENKGWSELIDKCWTLEVQKELQNSGLNLTETEIREVLDTVISERPDYDPTHNKHLPVIEK